MSAPWKTAKNWLRRSQEWIKTITGSRSKPTFPHSPSPCQLLVLHKRLWQESHGHLPSLPMGTTEQREGSSRTQASSFLSAATAVAAERLQSAERHCAVCGLLTHCYALAFSERGAQMQKASLLSALEGELLSGFQEGFANNTKGNWSRSVQFLKALGHGSWNECLENRLVFSSPLRLLASLAGSFSLPELQTLAASARIPAPFMQTGLPRPA